MTAVAHPRLSETRLLHLMDVTAGFWIDVDHLLHGPGVVTSLIEPESTSQPIIVPRSAILHTNAGPHKTPWAALQRYIARRDITGEPHFQLAGVDADMPGREGEAKLVQFMPLNRRADCNAKANSWYMPGGTRVGAISFETEDRGAASLSYTPWSLRQLHLLTGALTAICAVYGVKCTTPTMWADSGIGHHSQFAEWSIYKGKTCPGAARIRQMDYLRSAVATNLQRYAAATGWRCGEGGLG